MAVAITKVRAQCPECGRLHGRFPWERSYWAARAEAATAIDGGPDWTAKITCKACGASPQPAPVSGGSAPDGPQPASEIADEPS